MGPDTARAGHFAGIGTLEYREVSEALKARRITPEMTLVRLMVKH